MLHCYSEHSMAAYVYTNSTYVRIAHVYVHLHMLHTAHVYMQHLFTNTRHALALSATTAITQSTQKLFHVIHWNRSTGMYT